MVFPCLLPSWTLIGSVQLLISAVFIRGLLHLTLRNHEININGTSTHDLFWVFMKVLLSNCFVIPCIICLLALNRQHRGHSKRKLQFIR